MKNLITLLLIIVASFSITAQTKKPTTLIKDTITNVKIKKKRTFVIDLDSLDKLADMIVVKDDSITTIISLKILNNFPSYSTDSTSTSGFYLSVLVDEVVTKKLKEYVDKKDLENAAEVARKTQEVFETEEKRKRVKNISKQ